MARRIFISVLGIGYYNKTKYYFENKETAIDTHFIQEATLKIFAKEWNEKDRAFIFLTKKTKKDNWQSPAQQNNRLVENGERQTYDGLQKVLDRNYFPFKVKPINIPDGNDDKQIWEIFETVFGVLEEKDEVYFDITHAFRSLPMLVMVLINYAKFLKNIEVKRITYGNWEGRDKVNLSPIIDLTSFSELQDWTTSANNFVNFGNAYTLIELSKKDIRPLAQEFKGENETVNSLITINKLLPVFINNIQTCRGKEIVINEEGKKVNEALTTIKENLVSPLGPILHKIEEKIYSFTNKDNLINGFNAVKWCLDNNLLQQGFTLLQENIISLVCDELNFDFNKIKNRNIVSSTFTIKRYNKNPSKAEKFKPLLEKFYCNILSKIQLTC